MSVTFEVNGTPFTADSPEEAALTYQALRNKNLLNGSGPPRVGCDPKKCREFLNLLDTRQTEIVQALAESFLDGLTDEVIRSRFELADNGVWSGILSQITKKAQKVGLGDWYSKTVFKDHKEKGRPPHYRYQLTPQLLTVFRPHHDS
jgi:hypothetical protein